MILCKRVSKRPVVAIVERLPAKEHVGVKCRNRQCEEQGESPWRQPIAKCRNRNGHRQRGRILRQCVGAVHSPLTPFQNGFITRQSSPTMGPSEHCLCRQREANPHYRQTIGFLREVAPAQKNRSLQFNSLSNISSSMQDAQDL